MSLRFTLGTAALALLASGFVALAAGAQTVYDDERMDRRGDVYQSDREYQRDVDMRRDVQTERERELRSLPPRDIKLDVASVDRRYEQAFRDQTLGRKLGAADWAELRRQRSEIDDLKARIRTGHSVSPGAVDRALGYDDQKRVGY
jgi:hypothetical protein